MADIKKPIAEADTREYLDLGQIDGISYSQERQPKNESPPIIKSGHTFAFNVAPIIKMRGWLCNDCYNKRIVTAVGEVECFTNQNVAHVPCMFCKKSEGKYNIIITDSEIQRQIIIKWLEEING